MTRREAWLTALAVFVVALVVRVAAASLIAFPKPEDTAYYVGVARNLVEGRGLVSDAIWSYGTPPLVFPRPAFEVWLPLPSLLAAIPMVLSGARAPISLETAMRAGQVVSTILGSLLAVLAWRLASDVALERGLPQERARTFAIGTGLTVAAYLPLVLHSTLPDSTILFGVLALGAILLVSRAIRGPGGVTWRDPRVWAAGVLLGLAALTRNEAAWLALALAIPVIRASTVPRIDRVRVVGVLAVTSLALFAPWAIRDWAVFGSPLPGQAASNALSITGFDIFAWHDPPTLARYLAQGAAALAGMRVDGIVHNLVSVLLLLGIPVSAIGLVALPWQGRDMALRPLVLLSVVTFLVTSLVFPVATTWGTFLHAAVPVHVLLIIAALGALDAGLAALGRRFGWTRPVAWLGPLLAAGASALFCLAILPSFGNGAVDTARTYRVLGQLLASEAGSAAGVGTSAPIITDFPIWLSEADRIPSLALPDESPTDVLDLAAHFGAHGLLLVGADHGRWPAVLATGDPAARCFDEVRLPVPSDPADARAVADVRYFRITCAGIAADRSPSADR